MNLFFRTLPDFSIFFMSDKLEDIPFRKFEIKAIKVKTFVLVLALSGGKNSCFTDKYFFV